MTYDKLKLPSKSATHYAIGYYLAKNGTLKEASHQACVYDGVYQIWWSLIMYRVQRYFNHYVIDGGE